MDVFGFDLFRKARGISNSPVKPNRVRKSIGSERTYGKLLYNEDDIKAELTKNAKRVAESAQKAKKSRSYHCHQGSLFGLLNPNQTYDLGQINPGF